MTIIKKPIITEKAIQGTTQGRYTFKVDVAANKHQIAEEVEKNYKVDVLDVNIINIPKETKMVRGRDKAVLKPWKKAMVTLKKGQKIEGFEIKE